MKRRRKVKVGPVEVGVDTAKNGALFLGGFVAAEYAGAQIGKQVAQLNTTTGQGFTKLGLATITGVAAWKSKKYKVEGGFVAGGMAASGLKDFAMAYLPGEVVAYIPTTTCQAPQVGNYRSRLNAIEMGRFTQKRDQLMAA